ncbi:uncharacterized protein TRUGW13939_10392 [Talaromyces rugulosus]|uniref:GST N-terminal domain-containing protein n=1 Tax=Talaromyces rugulosus TaxID=121627 RepID=A0A7H8RFA9_TALRU|nr:uncharacterized protein TRUGW13939_10392 [Talaromyces rugulosus]QKX63223.1 hypothetical protein TRUGW13939_10392 [Talaromyces rugulosus]
MSLKPLTLWGHAGTPNPWKFAMILEELNVQYERKFIDFADLKKEPFESINPNGRLPAIEDPNTGISVWESGAILDAIDRYVNEIRRISGVLDRWLECKGCLVGGKYSYVNAAFVPWFDVVPVLWSDKIDIEKDFPHVNAWLTRIKARPAIAKALNDKAKTMTAEGI